MNFLYQLLQGAQHMMFNLNQTNNGYVPLNYLQPNPNQQQTLQLDQLQQNLINPTPKVPPQINSFKLLQGQEKNQGQLAQMVSDKSKELFFNQIIMQSQSALINQLLMQHQFETQQQPPQQQPQQQQEMQQQLILPQQPQPQVLQVVQQPQPLTEQENQYEEELSVNDDDNPEARKYKLLQRKRIKKFNTCGHPDKEHYAKGMCSNCYHKKGRTKKPWLCKHEKLYAQGLCQNCYINKYNQKKRIDQVHADNEQNGQSNQTEENNCEESNGNYENISARQEQSHTLNEKLDSNRKSIGKQSNDQEETKQ